MHQDSKKKKLTSITVDGISLAMIFGNFMVDKRDNIWSDRGLEDGWKANWSISCFVLLTVYSDLRTCRGQRHFETFIQPDKICLTWPLEV